MNEKNLLQQIPSVDRLLQSNELNATLDSFGHQRTTACIRDVLTEARATLKVTQDSVPTIESLCREVTSRLSSEASDSLLAVHNLTGTVLHTNLGRASLPQSAIDAVSRVASGNSNLEFDLAEGKRGDRDSHVEALLAELTGAEAVTIVNNNAAAVLLCLNTLAMGKEVCISRGELVEIGGSFRIPEVMERSGCRLREVGATNRTHPEDFEKALSDDTALLLKVHTSNYEIRGFTREVSYEEMAALGKSAGVPLLADLGSGTLVDLVQYGLEHEPTVQEVISAGADVVTFSGDKLLGGPQAGIIAGNREVISAIKKNPLKRALRVDKMTMAALVEVLKLYRHPEQLSTSLPTLRHLARSAAEVKQIAEALLPVLQKQLGDGAEVEIIESSSQIGSGALPLNQIDSFALSIQPTPASDSRLQQLVSSLRSLPEPVIGRLADGRLLLDPRTVDDTTRLQDQFRQLNPL